MSATPLRIIGFCFLAGIVTPVVGWQLSAIPAISKLEVFILVLGLQIVWLLLSFGKGGSR